MQKYILTLMAGLILTIAPALASASPAEGEAAPAFRLQDQQGNWQSLEDYRGQWIVLYFYPKDGTPGCTTEACNFRDDIYRYQAKGAAVLGVSLDDVASHREFAEKYSLPFPLLADVKHEVAEDYGVLTTLGPLKFAKRETFIIGPDGVIMKHYADVDPDAHTGEVLADLDALMNAGATGKS